MIGATMAQVFQEHDPNLICSSESTGGTSENIALISQEESTIGMGMADDIVSAYKGERDYKGRPASNLRVITTGNTNTFQIFVLASSNIHSLSDLKGKVISLLPSWRICLLLFPSDGAGNRGCSRSESYRRRECLFRSRPHFSSCARKSARC